MKSSISKQGEINWEEVQLVQHKDDGGIILVTQEGDELHNSGEFAGIIVHGNVHSESVGMYVEDWVKEEFIIAPLDVIVHLTNNNKEDWGINDERYD